MRKSRGREAQIDQEIFITRRWLDVVATGYKLILSIRNPMIAKSKVTENTVMENDVINGLQFKE